MAHKKVDWKLFEAEEAVHRWECFWGVDLTPSVLNKLSDAYIKSAVKIIDEKMLTNGR